MKDLIKFAITGCGKIAARHAEAIVKHGKLVAVCDIIPERANKFAERYGARSYCHLNDLLQHEHEVDLISICTPNGLHASQSINALESGFHVLCEKPLCLTEEDGKLMEAAAVRNDKKIFLVKSSRHNPALQALKKLIDNGGLGKLYSFQMNLFWNRSARYYEADEWRGSLTLDGGILFTQYSHFIDALLWLCGEMKDCKGFSANLANKGTVEFEDSGAVSVEMKNGMLGGINWSINPFEKNMEVSLTLIAEKGSIRLAGEYMNSFEYQFPHKIDVMGELLRAPNDYGHYTGSMLHHDSVYENLVIALNDSSHAFATVEDGIRAVSAIQKIYEAVKQPKDSH